jgi:hypothetical protein
MPIATLETMRSQQEHLTASMQTALEEWQRALVEKGAAILDIQRQMEQGLQEVLRVGMERDALLVAIGPMRRLAESVAAKLRGVRAIVEGDAAARPLAEAQIHVAERFLTWIRDLEAHVAAPIAPFNDSRLPPAPTGPVAEGYTSIREARARMRAEKKA